MSKEIKYKIETLNLLNQLSSISSTIVIEKKDDIIYVKRYNSSETMTFHFEAPIDDFNFDGDEDLVIKDYPEFYRFLTALKDPVIKLDKNKLIISKDKSVLKYVLTDPESIQAGPEDLNVSKYDVVFTLKADELKNIVKMIGLVDAKDTNISIDDGKIVLRFLNDILENEYVKSFEVDSTNEEDFDFRFPAEIFTLIPSGDYEISVIGLGFIVFKLKNDKINLRIATGSWGDDEDECE